MNASAAPRPSLDALIALAVEAGREIMAVRDAGFDAEKKADGSPVTIADQRAEAIIAAGLAKLAPGVPLLAEEADAAGETPALGDRFFCVDPLDGTRDFVEGGPNGGTGEFTVNIALVENATPIVGVIFAPATGALYAAEPGRAVKGVWNARTCERTQSLAPIRIAERTERFRVTVSRRSTGKRTLDFIAALKNAETHPSSSSVKFGLIAEGAADLYPRFGNVSEWDAAAGHAILVAAGGGLMRMDGSPVLYGRPEKRFLIDGFIAYGSAAAQQAAHEILAS